jgi:hypothetical protein
MLLLAGILLGGCSKGTNQPALALSREDLLATSSALELAAARTTAEVTATKQAWPALADGLPRAIAPATRRAVDAAAAGAAGIRVPALLTWPRAGSLTGPSAEIAGLFRTYALLSKRGWSQIAAAVREIQGGAPPGARFARENVALYIESVYDGHFTLAQIGNKLLAGYRALGGARAFGAQLPPARVSALARAYSEARDRLHPHVGVRLGS